VLNIPVSIMIEMFFFIDVCRSILSQYDTRVFIFVDVFIVFYRCVQAMVLLGCINVETLKLNEPRC